MDALSIICHKDMSYQHGKTLVTKMRGLIPRQMFDVVARPPSAHAHHRARV